LFAVDWPYAANKDGVGWMQEAPVSDATRNAIFSGNAKRLLGL
ncbi:MAG: amidohydrolase family protein, partial [Boseongicola sp. SB0673_bin_14]|nr:amidohydrolase family protein [Boseongicola sp. SB0673_bin_14]